MQPYLAFGRLVFSGAIALFIAAFFPVAAEDAERRSPNPSTLKLDGVVDLSGREQNPFADAAARAVVLIFISIECPICNRYAPEIQRLQHRFSEQGVVFWLVQPGKDENVSKTRDHLKEFGYSFGLLRDPNHALVKHAGVKVTPEVAVFTPEAKLLYRGRIDDRYAGFGKTRPAPTQRELQTVLEQLLAGRSITVTNTSAVGCSIAR
jgi:peroxiredoxin